MYVDAIHGSAYTSDKDYSALRGRIVQQHTIRGITNDGWVVDHTRTVIDFGKPPRPACDPDATIDTDETRLFDEAEAQRLSNGREATARRWERVVEQIDAHLAEHGPTTATELQNLTRWKNEDSLRRHLRDNPDRYIRLQEHPAIYALPGQTWADVKSRKLTIPARLRALLTEQGPLTVADICRMTGIVNSSVTMTLRRLPAVFVVVGERKAANGVLAAVWDVAR